MSNPWILRPQHGMVGDRPAWGVWLARAISTLSLSTLLCGIAQAHEASGNRATLIARDGGHFSLRLQADLLQTLHRLLAPQTPERQFLLEMAASGADEFAGIWQGAQRRWESQWALSLGDGRRVQASAWKWPTAKVVHALLREQLMFHLTQGASDVGLAADEAEHALLECTADFIADPAGVSSVELIVAASFAPLRLTTYRPQQHAVEPPALRVPLRF